MRIVICLIACLGCAAAGLILSGQLERRTRDLLALREGLDALYTWLQYHSEPLYKALQTVGRQIGDESGTVFENTAKWMRQGYDGRHAMELALCESGALRSLQAGDRHILINLASRMGDDRSAQSAAFGLAFQQLERAFDQAQAKRISHGRLYRIGGLLTGALLLVIFI